MRRLTLRCAKAPAAGNERGAVAVIVAVSMVALLGVTAISLDMGALYAERAQLQNGADAAALAVAQACAKTSCTPEAATAIAENYANGSANDGAANVATPTLTASSVEVTTSTRDGATGAGALALTFAPFLGFDSGTVAAEATAGWGSPASGPAILPLAFAPCSFQLGGATQVLSMHGDAGGAVCSSTSPSGQILPGGFGWLEDPTNQCSVNVDIAVNTPMSSKTGVSLPANCAAVLSKAKDQTVLVPVYEDAGGNGSGGWYTIRGWAAFTLLGWNFPGFSYNNSISGATCKGNCKGIIGKFVNFVSLDDRFTTGGPDLGVATITLQK
ncbi:MAG: hypothetical protein JWQ59_1223 [Cryobacterium sp.]|nr:hypothetical protein [Cryobacterium sp.]